MDFPSFNVARIPQILFGAGKLAGLPKILTHYGKRALFVTGKGSLKAAGKWDILLARMAAAGIQVDHVTAANEPTPEFVDEHAARLRPGKVDVVVAIGGGSAIDAGKAISAMIPQSVPVVNFLENIGTGAAHDGRKVPFIAIPTTAGTGSEATKNAVLRRIGEKGFKNSLRHDNFVPDVALIDPELHISCPPSVTSACGLDAFTQLFEAYTSTAASPFTDALALSGIQVVQQCLVPAVGAGAVDPPIRAGMAYSALLSGITLANAGLGVVHGLASPIGGFFDIPHGVVCGTLLAAATRVNYDILKQSPQKYEIALGKFARIGRLFSGKNIASHEDACEALVQHLEEWVSTLKVPRLGAFGVTKGDLDRIVAGAGNKNNPVPLSKEQIRQLVESRL